MERTHGYSTSTIEPMESPRSNDLSSILLLTLKTITLDGNGRFLIPKRYMKMANIEQQIRFTGMDDCIEIWATGSEEQPFMSAEEFSKAMEETMGN